MTSSDKKFNQLFAYMKGSFKSKWRTKEDWDLKIEPNYRQRFPNEIVLETDYESPQTNKEVIEHASKILSEKEISHQIWFSGNKSYHLNILFDKWLTKNMIEQWVNQTFKKALAEAFDDSNWNEKRLVGIENQPHQKTGKPKSLHFDYYSKVINPFPSNIKNIVRKKPLVEFKREFKGKCLICELATTKKFPESSNRHQHLVTNFVAIMPQDTWQKCADTQDKNIIEFENWAKIKPEFNCFQLQKYARKNQLGNVCEGCPYRKPEIDHKTWELKKKLARGW